MGLGVTLPGVDLDSVLTESLVADLLQGAIQIYEKVYTDAEIDLMYRFSCSPEGQTIKQKSLLAFQALADMTQVVAKLHGMVP